MPSEKIERIRKQLPAVTNCYYFNTGTNGPLCTATAEAMKQEAEKEYLEGRYLPFIPELYKEMDATRRLIAGFIGADMEEIALTQSATEGINAILWGIQWQSGDQIITTNREHIASLAPISLVSNRYDLTVKYLDVAYGDAYNEDRFVEELSRAITRRSRLLVVSHVSFSTGLTFPLKRLAEICHDNDMYMLVDGTQGAGATALDIHGSGVDFYAMAGRKWFLGPEGIAALYVAKERISEVRPTFISPSSVKERHDVDIESPFVMPAPYAARYQTATAINRPILLGFKEALIFLIDEVGREWLLERIASLVQYLRTRLETVPGLSIVTPEGTEAGFIHFLVDRWTPAEFCAILNERKYMIRPVPKQHLPAPVRVSVGFYNTEEEIDGLVANIVDVVTGGEPRSDV